MQPSFNLQLEFSDETVLDLNVSWGVVDWGVAIFKAPGNVLTAVQQMFIQLFGAELENVVNYEDIVSWSPVGPHYEPSQSDPQAAFVTHWVALEKAAEKLREATGIGAIVLEVDRNFELWDGEYEERRRGVVY